MDFGILLGDTWDSGMSKGIPLEFEMLRGLVLPGGFVNFGPPWNLQGLI